MLEPVLIVQYSCLCTWHVCRGTCSSLLCAEMTLLLRRIMIRISCLLLFCPVLLNFWYAGNNDAKAGKEFVYRLHLSIILDNFAFYHSFVFLKIGPNSVERLQTNSSKELNFYLNNEQCCVLVFSLKHVLKIGVLKTFLLAIELCTCIH